MVRARKYYPGMGTGLAEVKWLDDEDLEFGDDADLTMAWDGTGLNILPLVNDTGRVNFGNGTLDVDVRMYMGGAAAWAEFNVGDARMNLEAVDLRLGDDDMIQFGDAADVTITWDANSLNILPLAHDTGRIEFGDGTTDLDVIIFQGLATDFVLFDVGNKAVATAGTTRLDLGGVNVGVDGSVLRAGTAVAPLVDDQAGAGFIVGQFDCGATAGWPCGLWVSTNVTGAGGSFTALQGDPVISARKQVVTGIDSYMQFVTPGNVSGRAVCVSGSIAFGNYEITGGLGGGVYSAATFSLGGGGGACDVSLTQRLQFLELRTEGTWLSAPEVKAASYAIYFNGFTATADTLSIMSSVRLAELPANTIGIRVGVGGDAAAGAAYYIPLVPAAEWN